MLDLLNLVWLQIDRLIDAFPILQLLHFVAVWNSRGRR